MTYFEVVRRHKGGGGLYKSAASSDFYRRYHDAIVNYSGLRDKYLGLREPLNKLYELLAKKRIYFKPPHNNNPAARYFFDIQDTLDMARLGYKPSMDDSPLMANIQVYRHFGMPLSPYKVKQKIADRDRKAAKNDAIFDSIRRSQQAAEASASTPASDKPKQQEAASAETAEKAPEAAKPFNVRNYMGRAVGTTAGGAIGALAGNNLRNKILLGMLGGGTGYLAGDYYDRGSNSLIGRGASGLVSLFKSNRDKLLENKLNK